MRCLMFLAACLLALTVSTSAQVQCPSTWTNYNGSCYLLTHGNPNFATMNFVEGKDQPAANMYCQQEMPGSSLVTVNNQAENDFLYNWVLMTNLDPRPVWIGLQYSLIPPVGWRWLSGEPVTFTNWDLQAELVHNELTGAILFNVEPLIQAPNGIDIGQKWVDEQVEPGNEYYFICEFKQQPANPTTTSAPMTTTAAMNTAPTTVMNNNPAILRQNPMRFTNWLGFGGTGLHEVPRQRQRVRPASYRRYNPYYAVHP